MRTRLAAPVEPKTPSRSSSRRKAPANGDADLEELAGKVDRVLKVSEPVPQAAVRAGTRTARAAPTNAKPTADNKRALTGRAAPANSATSTGEASAATKRTHARTTSKAGPSRTTMTKPSSSRLIPRETPASTSRVATAVTSSSEASAAPKRMVATKTAKAVAARTTTTKTSSSRLICREAPASGSRSATVAQPARKAVSAPNVPKSALPDPRIALDHAIPAWADPSSSMDLTERVRLAGVAVMSSHSALTEISMTGYKSASVRVLPEGTNLGDIEEHFSNSSMALQVLRKASVGQGHLSLDTEKAALGILQKYIAFDMMQPAIKAHQVVRERLFSLCGIDARLQESGVVERLCSYPKRCERVEGVSKQLLFCQLMAYGWLCAARNLKGATASLHDLMPLASIESTYAHPLHMACRLPTSIVRPSLVTFYRDLPRIHTASADWLHIHLLSLQALVLASSGSGPDGKVQRYGPSMVWKHTSHFVEKRLKAGGDAFVEAEKLIDGVVEWAEWVVGQRQEDGDQWFDGEMWVKLMDKWISLGKKLGRSSVIDGALARIMSTTRVGSPSPTSANEVVPDVPAVPIEPRPAPLQRKASSADVTKQVLRFNGELASLIVLLNAHATKPTDLTAPSVISALKLLDMPSMSDAVSALSAEKGDIEALGKLVRNLTQARRLCRRQSHINPDEQSAQSYTIALQEWLVATLDLAEDFLQSTSITFQDIESQVGLLAPGSIDIVLYLCRTLPKTAMSTTALAYLQRGDKVLSLVAQVLSPSALLDSARALTSAANSWGSDMFNAGSYIEAGSYWQISYDISVQALRILLSDEKADKTADIIDNKAYLESMMIRVAEPSAMAAYKMEDWHSMMLWYGRVITITPSSILSQITTKLASTEERYIIDINSEAFLHLYRAARNLTTFANSAVTPENLEVLFSSTPLDSQHSQAVMNVFEAVADEIVSLATGCREAAVIALNVYRRAAETYEAYPISRIRSILRQAVTVLEFGIDAPVEAILTRATDCLSRLPNDTPSHIRVELTASLEMLRATASWHSQADAKMPVLQHATTAIQQLRSLLVPATPSSPIKVTPPPAPRPAAKTSGSRKPAPTTGRTKQPLGRATTTPSVSSGRTSRRIVSDKLDVADKAPKTPVRTAARSTVRHVSVTSPRISQVAASMPTWYDLPFLTDLLLKLISLLGMMGMTMQRIDALKLVRAMLRGLGEDRMKVIYVRMSGLLAAEYAALGKHARARAVLEHAVKLAEGILGEDGLKIRLEVGLRWTAFLASTGRVEEAKEEYGRTLSRSREIPPVKGNLIPRSIGRWEDYHRAGLAHHAMLAIKRAEGDATAVMLHTALAYHLASLAMDVQKNMAIPAIGSASLQFSGATSNGHKSTEVANGSTVNGSTDASTENDDPFAAPSASAAVDPATKPNGAEKTGADEPSKDEKERSDISTLVMYMLGKHLGTAMITAATELMTASLDLSLAFANRGSADQADSQLWHTLQMAKFLKSPIMAARVESRIAELNIRMRQFDKSEEKLAAVKATLEGLDGPDSVNADVLSGDLLRKQEAEGAIEAFLKSGTHIEKMEEGFVLADKTLATPRKASAAAAASPRVSRTIKDHLLPGVLAHVLRQRILLSAESGKGDKAGGEEVDIEVLMKRISSLSGGAHTAADLLLQGQLALIEVLKAFKADLFTSSLAESTISMPMTSLSAKAAPRSTTRKSAHTLLARAESAFSDALSMSMLDGRSEDVRQAGLSLAMLHAFQSSLGHGGLEATRLAADILASTSAVTLHRELQDVIDTKFIDRPSEMAKWPTLNTRQPCPDSTDVIDSEVPFRQYWSSVRLPTDPLQPIDLSPLPSSWAVVSISVSDDMSSMFVTRHQRDVSPVIFCLPFGRQGKREIEEDLGLPFELARDEMQDIVTASDECGRTAKSVTDAKGRQQWWRTRHELDARLKALLEGMEEHWFGAFKSILASQGKVTDKQTARLGQKLSKVFTGALQGAGVDMRKHAKVALDDAILRCFATLSADTSEDQLEDLIYFILDIYGFHGVPVAISELDIDQIGVDIRSALSELGNGASTPRSVDEQSEHLFLILDRHTQRFPWESMPSLRGQSISRVPSLPFLMDQLRLAQMTCNKQVGGVRDSQISAPFTAPKSASSASGSSRSIPSSRTDTTHPSSRATNDHAKHGIDARRAFYILNPSGDLAATQTHFESWMTGMHSAGWKGITGRAVTELEMTAALRNHELVVYFGHGGAEQYVRVKKLRALHRCATTMLWGCSSGKLKEYGDFDVTGTAWNYMMAGCPCLVANLWDVTDKDIDRLSGEVLKKLNLEPTHLAPHQNPDSSTRSTSPSISNSSPSKRTPWSKVFDRDRNTKAGISIANSPSETSCASAPGILPLAPMSVAEAVNVSRDDCRLRYLTGAAPVVYGLPVWLF